MEIQKIGWSATVNGKEYAISIEIETVEDIDLMIDLMAKNMKETLKRIKKKNGE